MQDFLLNSKGTSTSLPSFTMAEHEEQTRCSYFPKEEEKRGKKHELPIKAERKPNYLRVDHPHVD